MDGPREFLEGIRTFPGLRGSFRGLLHILVGRIITRENGDVLSRGLTWREASELLRVVRWDREWAHEVGLNPDDLPPRDRQRYWYACIGAAALDSPQSIAQADALAALLLKRGYRISPAPSR